MSITTTPASWAFGVGNYLTENELVPGQHSHGPWLTMNMVRPQYVSRPWRHHQAFGGIETSPASWAFGMGATDELAEVRAERAQVQAEIERLQKGGRPVVGGFQPRAPRAPSPQQQAAEAAAAAAAARAAMERERNRKLMIGAGLAAVVGGFLYFRKKR